MSTHQEQLRASSPEPPGPLPIKKLQESLINKIAAGEIIHRPVSALKELLENSLDAGATSISVTVKDGGMKLLQIQDNGCGIRKADLPILAERFTTSKLSNFSDLSRLTTYGFRGEALASISHVAHLSVITKTKKDTCAWKACYLDGTPVGEKPGQNADPKPCAGNNGTTIIIEDLFYNIPTRLSALRSSSEEYSRILDVLTKYAVHNCKVAFSCKKAGSSSVDLSTPSNSQVPNAIRLLYGHTIAKELLHVKVSSKSGGDGQSAIHHNDDPEAWAAEAHFTNANYQGKKTVFLLFINHRLVESSRMKRSMEGVYSAILPKGTAPFVYLSLLIDPRSVDVNVHPTKREVHFLNEDAITEKIADTIQKTLAAQSQSRSFEYQTLLTGGIASTEPINPRKRKGKDRETGRADSDRGEGSSATSSIPPSYPQPQRTASQHKVRTSQADRTLDSMFPVLNPAHLEKTRNGSATGSSSAPGGGESSGTARSKTKEVNESECYLTSVLTLRENVKKGKHRALTEILEKHVFVGIVDLEKTLSLIQYSTNLYLVNHASLAKELFYQLGLRQFGDFSRIRLEPPPSLRDLIEIAVNAQGESIKNTSLTKSQIIDRVVSVLMTRKDMLSEYFSLDFSEEGNVESLPLLLPDYTPSLDNLPTFLMRLGPQVEWTSEMECFDTFFRELALFYAPSPSLVPPSGTSKPQPSQPSSMNEQATEQPEQASGSDGKSTVSSKDDAESEEREAQEKAERWQIQHIIFPAFRRYMKAPKSLLDRDVVQIASLPELYKVFERC
ncbi:hypothetical protein AX16_001559 [Volvariella volvacea WC 439]|nr:hypothetical protein AX16_001559 [Volvariella volvacea WC 439]